MGTRAQRLVLVAHGAPREEGVEQQPEHHQSKGDDGRAEESEPEPEGHYSCSA